MTHSDQNTVHMNPMIGRHESQEDKSHFSIFAKGHTGKRPEFSSSERIYDMDITRRTAMKVLAGVVPALALGRRLRGETGLEIHKGPFEGTKESLQQYQIPEWFRDAKFGIWAHWGPQSSVEQGDWYARNMYIQGSRQYDYHVGHYGHPSKFSYKDLCPLWKAAEFEPEHLMGLYKQAGAKYFVSMGVHHDNFDLWNSRHTRWNAVKVGPHKDVVGLADGSIEARTQVRRQRTPVEQLQMVCHKSRGRQDGTARGRALRRCESSLCGSVPRRKCRKVGL